jgi:glycosyltransferase involved in cell wall biosynthesis
VSPTRFVIVAPSAADNSLGRALCVAATYELLGGVRVLAPDDGPTWIGASAWPITVDCLPPSMLPAAAAAACRAAEEPALIAIKPLPGSLGTALRVHERLGPRRPCLVLDLDEDDVELRRSSLRTGGPRTRLQRHWRYLRTPLPGHPLQVRRLLRRGVRQADLITTSSRALGDAVVPSDQRSFVLPHARAPRPYRPPIPASQLRIGFFGTLRRYKGVDTLVRLVQLRPDIELHLLGDRMPAGFAQPGPGDRVVLHPQRGVRTLQDAYAEADIIVLPQDPAARQTQLQLPAKLVDAMMFGRPIITTDTLPIREIGGNEVVRIRSWSDFDAVLAQIDLLGDAGVRERIGRALHAEAHARLTTTALAAGLGRALDPRPTEVRA